LVFASLSKGWGRLGIVLLLDRSHFRQHFATPRRVMYAPF